MAVIRDTTEKEPPTLSKRKKRTLVSSAYSNAVNLTSGRNNIMLLEWCCSDSSFFGMPSVDSRGCTVIRLTMRQDMTIDYGYRYAQSAANNAPRDNTIFVWFAIPCTGGSPWQNVNKRLPGGMERIQENWALLQKLWRKLVSVVDWLSQTGSKRRICIEWPKGCDY